MSGTRKAPFSETYAGMAKGQKTDLPHPYVDLSGTIAIVTGSNGGLGKEVVAKLAAMGPAKVIMAVRSISKGEAARDDLLRLNPSLSASTIEVWQLDMASFASVKAFAQRVEAELLRLDVVVLNAGIEPPKREVTVDGWEQTLQVNGIATFYLSLLLLPLLQKTARAYYSTRSTSATERVLEKPHLSIVSSGLHFQAPFVSRDSPKILAAMNEEPFETRARYTDTKMLEVLWAAELSRRVEKVMPGAVTILASNPGFCYSGLQDACNEGKPWRELSINIRKWLFARPTEMGARALTWAAISAKTTYSLNCEDQPAMSWTKSKDGLEVSARLWDETIAILTAFDPNIAAKVPRA